LGELEKDFSRGKKRRQRKSAFQEPTRKMHRTREIKTHAVLLEKLIGRCQGGSGKDGSKKKNRTEKMVVGKESPYRFA